MRKEGLAAVMIILVAAGLVTGYLTVNGTRAMGLTVPVSTLVTSTTTSTSQGSDAVNETILIHVVNSTSGEPIADAVVLAGPTSSATDISATLGNSWTIDECVHEVPSGSAVIPSENVAVSNSTTTTYPPCPLKYYDTNATGWVTISNQNATYFFIQPYAPQQTSFPNAQVVAIRGSQTYVTAPCPEGNFTVSSTS